MRQYKVVMQFNQAFRQMMLCLEDMSEVDKLSHYERGLDPMYRIAVRQARCTDVASAMAEVDIVADAHQVQIILPNIAHNSVSTPTSKAAPYIGVEPMQISALSNNNKYGIKKQPRMRNGPRQGRNNNGPPSSHSTIDMSKVTCFNCGKIGHFANSCSKKGTRRVRISMLTTPLVLTDQDIISQNDNLSPILHDDEAVDDMSTEDAVDTAAQAEVSLDLNATLPRCQQSHGIRQPIQAMVVTTRQSTAIDRDRETSTESEISRESAGWIEPRDEHRDQDGPCVHANLPEAEQEEGWYAHEDTHHPREDPRIEGIRTNGTTRATPQTRSTNRRRRPTTHSTCFDQALQSTRSTSVTANSSTPTMATPSVVVPPQATAIKRLGKENIPPPAEPVRRLARASSARIGSPAAVLADTRTTEYTPVSSVGAHSIDLQPVSPMFLDVEVFCYAVKHSIQVATKAMLDTGSSLSFISTRLFEYLPKSIMEPTSSDAQMADGSALAVKKCCKLSFKLVNGSHPNITCSIKCCVIRLPPQVDMLLGAPFHKDHDLRLDWRKWLIEFPTKVGRPKFSHSPPQYGPASHLSVLDCQKALRRGESVLACVVRPLAGGEEPQNLSPPDESATVVENAGPQIAAIKGDFADVFSDSLPKGLPPRRAIEHPIDLVPGIKPAARPAYKIYFAEQAELKTQLADLLARGSIQPSRSPYAAPVLFVKKKDTTALRMCCDFRLLNSQTIKCAYPLPTPMSLIDQLFGAQVFSKLDLRSGYYQIRVAAEDVAKTAFITNTGLYEWKKMPFGLCNAPATFQSLMNDLLRPYIGVSCLCYLDDVLIFSKNIKEHR